jgi:hypothetical protein
MNMHMYIDRYTVIARYRGCRLAVTCTWDQLYPSLNDHWSGFAHRQLEDGWTWRLDISRVAGQYSNHWGMLHVDEQWQTSNGQGQTGQREMSPWIWFLVGSNIMSLSVYIVIQLMTLFSLYLFYLHRRKILKQQTGIYNKPYIVQPASYRQTMGCYGDLGWRYRMLCSRAMAPCSDINILKFTMGLWHYGCLHSATELTQVLLMFSNFVDSMAL